MAVSLKEIALRFGGDVRGDEATLIQRILPLDQAQPGDLAFLANPKYRAQLSGTRASAVIVSPDVDLGKLAGIVVSQPYLYYARVSQWLNPPPRAIPGIHPTAVIDGEVHDSASIGPNVYIGRDAVVAAGAVIGANSVVLDGTYIGENTHLYANVTVYRECVVGKRCLVHAGAVIGSDGFGFARDDDGAWVKIPQVGRVVIGDDVEIGANTTIDRGALSDTTIGEGVKLDNQIQIGHNVVIGAHSAFAGCVGVAGSAQIGQRCTVGGAAVILGHLSIADDVNISAGTLVGKSITTSGTYSGTVPFMEHGQWLKNFARLRHLDAMADKLRAMELRLAAVEEKNER